jgi:hypothetical protein
MQKVKMQTAAHQAYTYQHMVFTLQGKCVGVLAD